MKSEIRSERGRSELYVDGKRVPAMAYTTYFEERSAYKSFLDAGYRVFFINLSFTDKPVNSFESGVTVFSVGAYENKDDPDYSEFEDAVRKILKVCPDAIIFARIYVSMPEWWIEAHPEATKETPKGGRRELLFSEAFHRDGAELLRKTVEHIRSSEYAENVAGWQLCGGLTQEWFYHDFRGGICPAAEEPYRNYCKEKYGIEDVTLPDVSEYMNKETGKCESENAKRYAEFCSVSAARTVEHFAKTIKEATNYEQIVGAFYGYTFNVSNAISGTHAIREIITSPYVDFFSSPCAYTYARPFGIDWGDMLPVDSIRKHGKINFIECDIRTHLTTSIQTARPGKYPEHIMPQYTADGKPTVWAGPETPELSRESLRKVFSHQLCRASAVWWFDMWGGWYEDEALMAELAEMRKIYAELDSKELLGLSAEIAFFGDERAFANHAIVNAGTFGTSVVQDNRIALGNVGAPYDSVIVEDAEKILGDYKVAIFPSPLPSEAGKKARELCRERGIPYLEATAERPMLTIDAIMDFLKENGVHIYSEEKDVVYAGNGYVALHSKNGGKKALRLPEVCRVHTVFGAEIGDTETNVLSFELAPNATALFELYPLK